MRRAFFLWAPLLAACVADGPAGRLGTAQQANVCATGATLEGVDVSVYDGTVDWPTVKSSGRAFGIAKATEGASLVDGQFAKNWSAMKSAGVVRSAYHFFHCDTAPATQASQAGSRICKAPRPNWSTKTGFAWSRSAVSLASTAAPSDGVGPSAIAL